MAKLNEVANEQQEEQSRGVGRDILLRVSIAVVILIIFVFLNMLLNNRQPANVRDVDLYSWNVTNSL